jgi:hypothetical protein
MRLIERAIGLFEEEPLPTEHWAYQLLKARALRNDVTYLAVPWSVLINRKRLTAADFPVCSGGITVCQHVRFETIIPLLKRIGINTLFTPHAEKRSYELTVRPFPLYASHGVPPKPEKDILCSFVGFDSTKYVGSRLRQGIFRLHRPESVILKERSAWHFQRRQWWQVFSNRDPARERREYQDILARSRFSLCPRGTGPNTVRLWESLQAGAIPVLLADSLRLPDGIPWEQCLLRVPERCAGDVYDIIASISPTQEEEMRRRCLLAYRECSGEAFVDTIRTHCRETV